MKQGFFKARNECMELKNRFSNLITYYEIKPDGITLRLNNKNMNLAANIDNINELNEAIDGLNLVSIFVKV